MQTDYGFASNKRSIMVKNGAATSTISYVSSRERREMRENVGISGRCAIFIASWHEPNIEAVRQISKFAERSPDIFFLVVGSVGDYFKTANEAHAQNMAFTGVVTAEEKDVLLQIVDLGLNPMSTGSGTNIKMFDYMAAGLPIVTTPVGARGLELPQGIALTGELDSFSVLIREALILRRSIQRRLFVMERYDWDVVGREYRTAIRDLVEQSNSRI
jgi:glycosyltransferase involved in cell wall biosynthesis